MMKRTRNVWLLSSNRVIDLRPRFLFCALAFSLLAKSQNAFLDSLQSRFATYKNSVLQEKVFVHTDKSFYLTGETLWFKAYVVDAVTNRETDFSKVVYVELLDVNAKPLLQAAISNRQSSADGSFLLPASLNTGAYVLRAYTAWMKNFDETGFFQTSVQIVNTARRPDWASLVPKDSFSLRFYPEGGNLVEGLPTRLGFQLMNQYGQGASGDGFIIKNDRDTVAHFRPGRAGIGNVDFTPLRGSVYKAVVRFEDGRQLIANLPFVYKEGYVLHVSEEAAANVKISVATNKAFTEKPVYLLAHSRGAITSASAKIIATGKGEWLLDKKDLSDGINVFTLFDGDGKPVCERLYFKRPVRKLNIALSSDAASYTTRSNVRLTVSTHSSTNDMVQSRLSLSVFLLDSLQGLPQSSIDQYLSLASEVKGNIESPAYYFTADNAETATALDNLLLTQGWRRFVWEDVAEKTRSSFPFLPEYEGPVITGKVSNRLTGEAVPNVLCYLSAPAEKFYAGNAISNATGDVHFVAKDLYGSAELAVQTAGVDSNVRIDLQSPYSLTYSAVHTTPFLLAEGWKEQLATRHLNTQLTTVFATPAMQSFILPFQTDTLPFYGRADTRYKLDEYTRFPSMEEVMREITGEVRVAKDRNGFRYSVLNLPYKTHFEAPPLVLFDGVPVTNTNKIIAFDPLKVKYIDVVARNFFWGNTTNSGIVSYATYDGNLSGFALDPGVLLVEYNGLQVKREFYSPSYNSEILRSREPDRRNVLLWMPSITTDEKGNSEISFYTSDLPGRYVVFVQGLGEGLAGSKSLVVDVK